jgi:hypothetical protein
VSSDAIMVLKRSGEYEPFSEDKVRSSLERAGADDDLIDIVVGRVKGELYDGISTKELYRRVYDLLSELERPMASRYDLKNAILQLGPTGFPFERFVAGLLRERGYHVAVGQIVPGKCVEHEVDVVAHKGHEHLMIEAKFHNQPGTKSDIQDALYTYARFLDVEEAWVEVDGREGHLHRAWLVTNTKVTSQVRQYTRCVGMRVTSWDYPYRNGLRDMVDESGLHPVTLLQSLTQQEKARLVDEGVVFCRELIERDVPSLSRKKLVEARDEARRACVKRR